MHQQHKLFRILSLCFYFQVSILYNLKEEHLVFQFYSLMFLLGKWIISTVGLMERHSGLIITHLYWLFSLRIMSGLPSWSLNTCYEISKFEFCVDALLSKQLSSSLFESKANSYWSWISKIQLYYDHDFLGFRL